MQYWIIDRQISPLPTWNEAFPGCRVIDRKSASILEGVADCLIWIRCRFGESPTVILQEQLSFVPQRFVFLADQPDETLVMKALESGAAGCCNTYAAPEVLKQVAIVVENGGYWVGQMFLQHLLGVTTGLIKQQTKNNKNNSVFDILSDREIQVARLVGSGASNKEIAIELSISERTVKAHLSAIFEKTKVRDRLQLSLRLNGLSLE